MYYSSLSRLFIKIQALTRNYMCLIWRKKYPRSRESIPSNLSHSHNLLCAECCQLVPKSFSLGLCTDEKYETHPGHIQNCPTQHVSLIEWRSRDVMMNCIFWEKVEVLSPIHPTSLSVINQFLYKSYADMSKKLKGRLRDPRCNLQRVITQPILRLFWHICTEN